MFPLFFCLLLVWGSNKFERDFSLFCLVFWAFRFPLKIVFQGYDHQSHSYTQFACLMFQVYIHRAPFLVTGAFSRPNFSILIPGLLFWDCWFFSENILRKEASAHFSLSNTLSHFPKFSAYTSATEIHLDPSHHHTPRHKVAVSVALLNKEAKNVMFEILNKLIWYTMWPKVPMNSERGKVFVLQVTKMRKVLKKV